MNRWGWVLMLLALTGCAEQRKFWKEVDADKTANSDYGAGKKP